MYKLNETFKEFLFDKHPDLLPLIMFGHAELITEDIKKEYVEWLNDKEK